jgi:hypothetical protein
MKEFEQLLESKIEELNENAIKEKENFFYIENEYIIQKQDFE